MKCVVCGSERIIPGATIFDQGQYSDTKLKIGIAMKPDAMLFKELFFTNLRASICGDCGHVELSVEQPRELYGAYLAGQQAAQG